MSASIYKVEPYLAFRFRRKLGTSGIRQKLNQSLDFVADIRGRLVITDRPLVLCIFRPNSAIPSNIAAELEDSILANAGVRTWENNLAFEVVGKNKQWMNKLLVRGSIKCAAMQLFNKENFVGIELSFPFC